MMKLYSIYLDNKDELFYIFDEENIYLDSQCEDITDIFIKIYKSNSHKIIEDDKYYVDNDGNKYYDICYNPSVSEIETAYWLKKKFGGEIRLQPRVNKPDNIKTPDYIWNNQLWDYKETTGKGKRTIEDLVKKQSRQAHNFIIDITNSKLTMDEITYQIKKLFTSKTTNFIEIVIVKRKDEVVAIYAKKRLAATLRVTTSQCN